MLHVQQVAGEASASSARHTPSSQVQPGVARCGQVWRTCPVKTSGYPGCCGNGGLQLPQLCGNEFAVAFLILAIDFIFMF